MIFNESLETICQRRLHSGLLPWGGGAQRWSEQRRGRTTFPGGGMFGVPFSRVGEKMGVCVLLCR